MLPFQRLKLLSIARPVAGLFVTVEGREPDQGKYWKDAGEQFSASRGRSVGTIGVDAAWHNDGDWPALVVLVLQH